MINKPITEKTSININKALEGETIENKVRRILMNKEPITDGAPIIYTDRKDGVQAAYNIRTDRFEVAIEAMDYVNRSNTAKRDNVAKQSEQNENEQSSDNTSDMQEPK